MALLSCTCLMASWQKRARLGVATFGLTCAVVVYLALGERRKPTAAAPAPRLDPRVVLEGVGIGLERAAGSRQAFVVQSARTFTYDDGTKRHELVRIEATNADGRTFVVTAREGLARRDDQEIELTGDVVLLEGDGFELRTAHAVFYRDAGEVRTPGPVTFLKGRMTGSGLGMTYSQGADRLRILDRARVEVAEGEGLSRMAFAAGAAALDRVAHVLTMERSVRVEQGAQVTEADRVVARLTEADDTVTFVELRGHARVTGDGAVDAMRAREIDLDYADGQDWVERAVLRGEAGVVLKRDGGAAGRELTGSHLDVQLQQDGGIARVSGDGGVQMIVAGAAGASGRRVEARTFDATGDNGHLTSARFAGDVRYEEASPDSGASRTARSETLTLVMDAEAIRRAEFVGGATFHDGDLRATAATATYAPDSGALGLRGSDARGRPRVADSRVSTEAGVIDVTLAGRRIEASARVETTLRGGSGGSANDLRLPGLLRPNEQATVISDTLVYDNAGGTAHFAGSARLWQGETEIRAHSIELRHAAGDLLARGGARSVIALDGGRSEGYGDEIRYTEEEQLLVYETVAAGTGTPRAQARVTGREGDLRGRRVEVWLARDESRVERVEAHGDVAAIVGARTVTGDRLSYRAADGSYHVTGGRDTPVTVEESCRVATGRALTFTSSTDTMNIDGRTDFRTQAARKSGCADPPPR